ncbi:MAG: peptidylprolyl isomerase [Opitutales bacterium]
MEIAKDRIVTIHYELTDPEGKVLDSSRGREPLTYLHGHGNLIPGLETRIAGSTAEDSLEVTVPAAEGYGEHDSSKTIPAQRSQFPAEAKIEPGAQFQAEGPNGPMVVRVMKIEDDVVTLDANHPLAGVDLKFAVDVVEVREASEEELAHGHAHGPGGHQH